MSNGQEISLNKYVSESGCANLDVSVSNKFHDTLCKFGMQYGTNVYKDLKWLQDSLLAEGVSPIEIYQLYMIMNVPGFYRLIDGKDIVQTDINTFIMNAYEKTGLLKPLIINIITVILESIGSVVQIDNITKRRELSEKNFGYIIPYALYKEDIEKLQQTKPEERNDEYHILLDELVKLGVPKAKFIRGQEYFSVSESERTGFALIREAAEAGDDEAERFLGRYYFENNRLNDAYKHYTSVGAGLLEIQDRQNLITILNSKELNKRLLVFECVFLVVSLLAMLVTPLFSISVVYSIFGILGIVLQIAIVGLSFFRYMIGPFLDLYPLLGAQIAIWLISMTLQLGI